MNKGKNRIIVNTSPWIALSICGQNHLLKMTENGIWIKEDIIEGMLKAAEED